MKAVQSFGLAEDDNARDAVKTLFQRMDKDGSGTIEIKELITGLRRSDRSAARLDSAEPFIAGIGEPPGPQMAGGFLPRQKTIASASLGQLGATWDPISQLFVFPDGGLGAPDPPVEGIMKSAATLPNLSLDKLASMAPTHAASHAGLQRSKSRVFGGSIRLTADRPMRDQIIDIINKYKAKIMHLLEEWDENGDGVIQKPELQRALKNLGLSSAPEARGAADELFDLMDKDGSGEIEMSEFFKALRPKTTDRQRQASQKNLRAAVPEPEDEDEDEEEVPMPTYDRLVLDNAPASAPTKAGKLKLLRQATRAAAFVQPKLVLPPAWSHLEDRKIPHDQLLGLLRPRAPIVQPGSKSASLLRQPRSLHTLKKMKQEEIGWYKQAMDVVILPPTRGGTRARSAEPPPTASEQAGAAPSGPTLLDQLREALVANLARVLDLFRGLDENGDGNVSKKEFRKALPLLGLTEITRDTADLFFNTIDEDGSGSIQYSELSKKLRRKVTDTAGIQPTAAGKGGLRLSKKGHSVSTGHIY